ncbi:hypothetical protein CG002_01595 [Mesoplasma florum]|uniref:AlwI family type II restriction endonuclease n=1 Tax=Mesoplasma florum TaxID=2151 RepID=UPI000D091BA3|nr:AlwI family type II restriction endonuclease [Mesoplasma florum]AVN65055.1 hypothetical protein CG002_01595 [Mesoplasma florum]
MNNVIWRLGDTSWRKRNQIGLYESVLDILYSNKKEDNEFSSHLFYKEMFEKGLKEKPNPSKKSDVNLLLKTLKWFNLVKENELTNFGLEFYNYLTINISQQINDFNLLLKKYFNFSWKQWCWFSLLLNFKLSNDRNPFFELIIEILKNDKVDENWIVNWLKINNESFTSEKELEKIKNGWNWEKKPNGVSSFEKLKNGIKFSERSVIEDSLNEIMNLKSTAIKKNISFLINESEIIKFKKKGSKTIDSKEFMNKKELIISYFLSMNIEKFNIISYKAKNEITIRDEYLNIMMYWLNNLGIFEISSNNSIKFNFNTKFLIKFIIDYFKINLKWVNEKYLHKDIFNQLFIKKLTENILQKCSLKEEEKPPFKESDVLDFFNMYNEKVNKYKILSKFKLEGTDMATVVEYFINLNVWFKIKKNNLNIKSFRECCNTTLDSKLFPISTASGNMPDGFIELDEINLSIETTLLDSNVSLRKNETEPIQRHSWDLFFKNNKKTIVYFYCPKVFNEFVQDINYYFNISKKLFGNSVYKPKDRITINLNTFDNHFINKMPNLNFSFIEKESLNKFKVIIDEEIMSTEKIENILKIEFKDI